jgi:GNAT superfamily N-acetyltransferase
MVRGVYVRRARLEDLEVLVRHRRAMWNDLGTFSKLALDQSDRAYSRWLRQRIGARRIVAFIASDSQKSPLGSLTVWLHDVEPSPDESRTLRPLLSTLYTEPDSRKRGVATALVRAATRWSRSAGYGYVTGIAAHTSRHLLRRLGYQRLWEMGKTFGREPT